MAALKIDNHFRIRSWLQFDTTKDTIGLPLISATFLDQDEGEGPEIVMVYDDAKLLLVWLTEIIAAEERRVRGNQ